MAKRFKFNPYPSYTTITEFEARLLAFLAPRARGPKGCWYNKFFNDLANARPKFNKGKNGKLVKHFMAEFYPIVK